MLRPEGRMTVIFGHSDPRAWKRLLAALTDAGFVVTSSWPSRTRNSRDRRGDDQRDRLHRLFGGPGEQADGHRCAG